MRPSTARGSRSSVSMESRDDQIFTVWLKKQERPAVGGTRDEENPGTKSSGSIAHLGGVELQGRWKGTGNLREEQAAGLCSSGRRFRRRELGQLDHRFAYDVSISVKRASSYQERKSWVEAIDHEDFNSVTFTRAAFTNCEILCRAPFKWVLK